jgi:phage terminase small subunit
MLNAKKTQFVREYLVDMNAAAAARRAGYSERTAGQQGFRLLQEPEVAQAIQEAIDARSRRTEITADRVLRELARLAFADQRAVMTWGPGGIVLRPSEDLTDDEAAAVVEVSETVTGKQTTLRVKTADKLGALRMLGQHLGMFGGAGAEKEASAEEIIGGDADPEVDDRGGAP